MIIAAVTLYFQFTDPVFRAGVFGVAIYYAVMMAYFLLIGPPQAHPLARGGVCADQGRERV